MNPIEKNSDSDEFMKQLLYDIKVSKVKDSRAFVKHKNLKIYKFNKKNNCVKEDDLPVDTLLGSSYLIKGNNILETYAWCDSAYSLYLQTNVKRSMWIGDIYVINVENNDPENLEYILNGCGIYYSSSNLQHSIIQLIHDGFSLYIKSND